MAMNAFEWVDAASVAQAVDQLGGKAALKAGGVDLLDLMKEGVVAPPRIVNLRTIPGLDRIADDPQEGLRVGPLVTLARLAAEPVVRERYTALAEAAGHAATPQIRNLATLGGNLLQRPRCWYFRSADFNCLKKGGPRCFALDGENAYHAIFGNTRCAIVHPSATATALVALGATLRLEGRSGQRDVSLDQFLTAPEMDVTRENTLAADEVLTEVRLPPPPPNSRSTYYKQGEKESFDWPIAEVAVVLERDGDRCRRAVIVLGAAAPVPWRSKEAEAALTGQPISEETARAAADAAVRGATPLEQNAYKIPIFRAIIRRTILAAASD
jgi:xanthine dehydrogenase YagS FAD-binding subunit